MIEHYTFGSMTIKGKRYDSDLKIVQNKVIPNWWRKEGHKLFYEDIMDIIETQPEILIIGTGASGLMQVDLELKNYLKEKGISVIIRKTGEAASEFNRFYEEGKKVAGAFHLTC